MSYQPRRVADVLDAPADSSPFEEQPQPGARRAATSLADRVFHRGGAVLAAVTVVATAAVVAIGSTGGAAVALGTNGTPAAAVASGPLVADSLATKRPSLTSKVSLAGTAVSRLYTKASLNVRAEAGADADLLGRLTAMSQVRATAEVEGDYRKVVYKDGFGWVLTDSLSDSDTEAVPDGTSMAPCSRGDAVENKLRKTTIFIYRSVCPLFPEVNSYGGWRAGGMQFHKNGRALDIMLTPGAESALGHRIAKYLIAHRVEFKVDHIIFEQHIWTPSNPTWRKMADRGSANANHFNHVHVAVVASAP